MTEGRIIRINKQKAAEAINRLKPQYLCNPVEMQSVLEESIEAASYVVKDKKANILKQWWFKEIDDAYQAKRLRRREYNRSKTLNFEKPNTPNNQKQSTKQQTPSNYDKLSKISTLP